MLSDTSISAYLSRSPATVILLRLFLLLSQALITCERPPLVLCFHDVKRA